MEQIEFRKQPRILVADDSRSARELIRNFLEQRGYAVTLVADGKEAVRKFRETPHDLVLMDANMPVVDGYRACTEIRRSHQGDETGIIMITGQEDDESVEKAFSAGAEEYITKPIHWVVLEKRIRLSLENRLAREEIQEARARMEAIVSSAPDAIIVINDQGLIESTNLVAARMFGYPLAEMVGQNVSMLMPSPYREQHDQYLANYRTSRKPNVLGLTRELVAIRRSGAIFPMELTISEVRLKNRYLFTAILRDITERKQAEEKIFYQANYDALTGLANRALFMSTLEETLKNAKQASYGVALLFIDLDRFKWVNDTLGHAAGDALLKMAAERIREPMQPADTVARLGGDEFTAILKNCSPERALETARTILHRMNDSFTLEGEETFISGSLGVAFYPQDSQNLNDLLKHADEAMYRSKRAGRNACHFYSGESFALPRKYA
ncbi:MAG: diguanylate cyclase [Magnetococcales bacterium]|nr:diguanylate cyclase [Magnetococcales bacterium]NGZ05102.1 diguanylate cyclase [Magnetococcales bacterium]